ncbi:hypothetical protein Q0F99_16420 [Rathayibacter oskolensis]|uniref:hypothetical protein n=1 Tax=Rathayibacter oskolensis TaxID=1891671 RepID=UPI00265E2047|nr:hypothetical protein [Rathayibacter oskolensis]WKK71151.1 hypothetical protein Q0F99_16420 [Rathayibacter oskolensis]
MTTDSNTTLRELTADECWRLARSSDIGRLAVIDHRPAPAARVPRSSPSTSSCTTERSTSAAVRAAR